MILGLIGSCEKGVDLAKTEVIKYFGPVTFINGGSVSFSYYWYIIKTNEFIYTEHRNNGWVLSNSRKVSLIELPFHTQEMYNRKVNSDVKTDTIIIYKHDTVSSSWDW